MDVRSIELPRRDAVETGIKPFCTKPFCTERFRARLRLLEALAAEIEDLKRRQAARQRLPMYDPDDAAIAHAAANIAEWRRYLPENCVRAMIRHGWHWST